MEPTLQNLWAQFQGAIIVAIAGAIITGIGLLVCWFLRLGRNISEIQETLRNMADLTASNTEIWKPMLRVNKTLVEIASGQIPNGNVEKAFKALEDAERIYEQAVTKAVNKTVTQSCNNGGK